MEAARAYQELGDVMAAIVERVTSGGVTPSQAIDEMWPIRLVPQDADQVLRLGLISLANDRAGMRSFRSGRVQSVTTRVRPVLGEMDGLLDFAERILSRVVFEGVDGVMRSVLDFTHDDASAAYDRRVRAVREQADREAPFWRALVATTKDGRTLAAHSKTERGKLAKLAIAAELTRDIEE